MGKHRHGRLSRSSRSQEAHAYWSSLFQTSSLAPWEHAGNGIWVQTPWRLHTMWAGHFEIEDREDDRGKFNRRWRDMRQKRAKIASPETILLVDDNDQVRSIMARALRAGGYHVVEASDAAMALSALKTRPELQLVVADIVMPDLSGFDLASHVIADHNLPVLFISSGQVQIESVVPGPLLQKPFTTEALLEAVRSLLPVTTPALKLPIWHPGGPTPFDDESNAGP